jgi:integrase
VVVTGLGLAGLVRHGLRHTALTWMADAGTARYLHPDHAALLAAGTRFSAWWGLNGDQGVAEAASSAASSGA